MSVPHSAARGGDPGPTVLYLAADAFGHAVVERLAVHRPGEVLAVDGGTHPSLWPWADLVVLATGSERSRTVEALDVVSHRHGTPWLPVVARPTEVQVGPAVVPGVTPCHRCSERRRRQHGLAHPTGAAVPPSLAAPYAVLRHHVAAAAALARRELEAVLATPADAPPTAGTVRQLNLVSGAVASGSVVAVDGCGRCRGRFGSRQEFSQALWDRLEEALPASTTVGAVR